jgi:hypothetical protein
MAPSTWSFRAASFSACLLLLTGCGPGNLDAQELSHAERAVRVYHQGQRPECKYSELGTVEATSGTAFTMGTYESSVAKMQRAAAAKGATAVLVLDHSKNQMADQTTGMAIRCNEN